MVRRGRRKKVDRYQAARYLTVARGLRRAAADLAEVAEEEGRYGNAIAIVAVHAAIAYADSLCISYGELKSTAGEHEQVLRSLYP